MAGTSNDFQNGAPFYLDATQQDLLLAALASNNQNTDDLFAIGGENKRSMSNPQYPHPTGSIDASYFTSPTQPTPSSGFTEFGVDESPFVGLLDGDTSLDFDNTHGDLMIGALPEDASNTNDSTEKRKNPGDEDEEAEDEGGGKRREGEDKQAKKPGRKPLTSEPTTKRKAQNRAAQRAFRERKEKHLKDLETKVQELEKASDATSHENGLLRAQVQRLQVELSEYRKRLSLSSTNLNRSPPQISSFNSLLSNNNNFSFDFPRFGGLPGAQLLDNGPLSKTKSASISSSVPPRQNSTGRSISPTTQLNGSMTSSPGQIGGSPAANSVHRSGSLNASLLGLGMTSPPSHNVNQNTADGFTKSPSRVFQFNSGSSTHSDSPSTSSTSPNAVDSSCGTSPAPSHNSPNQQKDAVIDGYGSFGNSEVFNNNSPNPLLSGIDFFANQNGGQFDPTLFGDYRDTQTAIVGDGDFTNGFFNDAFLNTGYASPFHFGDTPAVQKPNPLDEIERIQNGEEEVVPGEDRSAMLNCHKIWDKLSSRPDFKDGTIDIDNLCSELRAKARCSESGVVVDHKDVEAALERMPKDSKNA